MGLESVLSWGWGAGPATLPPIIANSYKDILPILRDIILVVCLVQITRKLDEVVEIMNEEEEDDVYLHDPIDIEDEEEPDD